jgi:hypothetical protein
MPLSKVDFFDLRYDHRNRSPILFLKDADSDKFLLVWIGELEASSIELAVIRKTAPRPLTHDLFAKVLNQLDVSVDKVVIDRLESRTYYATLYMEHNGEEVVVDCRPSDAIAIALRENAQILVDEELMYSLKYVELEEDDSAITETSEARLPSSEEEFQEFLRNISPTDFGES